MVLFFYIFALLSVVGSFLVITSKNPVHSVLWLIFVFCNGSGLMVIIGAEFIAMMLIIIYVGAVAVLFLFVVMMLNISDITVKKNLGKESLFSIFISLLLFFDLVLVIYLSKSDAIPSSFYGVPILENVSNVNSVGLVLYTDFILAFQTSGIILFVAMIASIALTLRVRSGVKKQDVNDQLCRNKENSMSFAGNNGKEGLNNISYDD